MPRNSLPTIFCPAVSATLFFYSDVDNWSYEERGEGSSMP